jgi:glycosyltransferase involved in cell wall biosynthesis
MRRVFFYLDNLTSIDTPIIDFLHRFEKYARAIQDVSNSDAESLSILTSSTLPNPLETTGIKIERLSRFLPLRFLQSLRTLRRAEGESTLIAGNNHGALIYALAIRIFIPSVRVQASLHGKLSLILPAPTIKSKIRVFLIKVFIPRVDSLRIVDELEKVSVGEYFRLPESAIVVAPVPVEIPNSVNRHGRTNPNVVGFVGRIHAERGVREWVDIALAIAATNSDTEFLVIGDGNLATWMKSQTSSLGKRIRFTGKVDQRSLDSLWNEIGLLLICAPSESYGMAARESLLHGVPVIARNNSSSEKLHRAYPDIVKTYSDMADVGSLVSKLFLGDYPRSQFNAFRADMVEAQESSLRKLALSWVK